MRATLDIEDDVQFAVREIARREKKSLGQVISELARRAFGSGQPVAGQTPSSGHASERLAAYGITPLPARGALVTNALIERLREEEGI